MSTRLNALADRVDGTQSFGLTNYDHLQADVDYYTQPGATLASTATLTITNFFHTVTGSTAIQNINDALGAIASQQVILLFESAITISHDAGGVGNLRIPGGDMAVAANTLVTFTFDGTNWWTKPNSGRQLDYAQITAPTAGIAATTEATAVAVVTGHSVTYDGSQVKVEFWCPGLTISSAGCVVTFVLLCDATVVGHAMGNVDANTLKGSAIKGEAFYTPSAAAHTFAVKAFTSAGAPVVPAGAGGAGQNLPAFLCITEA